VQYIKDEEADWQDGTIIEMIGQQLMSLGKQKFALLDKLKVWPMDTPRRNRKSSHWMFN
jgi:hypothetical protein